MIELEKSEEGDIAMKINLYTLPDRITEHKHARVITNLIPAQTPIHMHEYFEIELVLKGKCKQFFNGKIYDVGRGSLYFLSPVDFHNHFDFEDEMQVINISFDNYFYNSDVVQNLMNKTNDIVLHLNEAEIEKAEKILELLKESCESDNNYTERNIKNMLEYFLDFILVQLENKSNISFNSELNRIQKGIKYLFGHFRENPTAEEIAKISGYSTDYFCKQFKSITGKTYVEFLNTLKLNHAKILLLTSNIPILEISEICGFNSVSNFNRVFKEKTSLSPSEFAKHNKK